MTQPLRLTAIIEREEDGFVSLCPELDVASQGSSIEEARANLIEALSLFFETADPSEVARRFRSEIFVTQVEVPVG
ncbi:MAG: type II toxin-antitoxin system HicB family antitoxin [Bryobacteraceae bacterium]|jgi:predicted RNase H-like HicB family nuclease